MGEDFEAQVRAMTAEIGAELIAGSRYIDQPDFTAIHPDDLALLFDAYDARFLNGAIRRRLGERGVAFRLSSRMTRAGGKTTRRRRPDGTDDYEIAVSTSILFDAFTPGDPEVTVAGLPCANRLEALQRIMEHEIVHLVEFLRTGTSNCSAQPFRDAARRLFGHRSHTHQLFTRVERAARRGIVVGSLVAFDFRGERLTGRVNRITKRATVLVENPSGDRYSDGRRYEKYYVPLSGLELGERT